MIDKKIQQVKFNVSGSSLMIMLDAIFHFISPFFRKQLRPTKDKNDIIVLIGKEGSLIMHASSFLKSHHRDVYILDCYEAGL
jgi:hypothetical protein